MGLGLGGKMKQEIFKDKHGLDTWDTANSSRCFVHIANSEQYHSVTNSYPPTQPPTAEQYTKAGLPWFDYYDESQTTQAGSDTLAGVESIDTVKGKGSNSNEPKPIPILITPERKKKSQDGTFLGYIKGWGAEWTGKVLYAAVIGWALLLILLPLVEFGDINISPDLGRLIVLFYFVPLIILSVPALFIGTLFMMAMCTEFPKIGWSIVFGLVFGYQILILIAESNPGLAHFLWRAYGLLITSSG